MLSPDLIIFFFFFNDTATTEIYTLSLHDALPISTMDAPDRELDADALQRFAPGEHVLVHAVHEGAVEIEEECRAGGHGCRNVVAGLDQVGAQHAAPLRILRDVFARRLCSTPSLFQ